MGTHTHPPHALIPHTHTLTCHTHTSYTYTHIPTPYTHCSHTPHTIYTHHSHIPDTHTPLAHHTHTQTTHTPHTHNIHRHTPLAHHTHIIYIHTFHTTYTTHTSPITDTHSWLSWGSSAAHRPRNLGQLPASMGSGPRLSVVLSFMASSCLPRFHFCPVLFSLYPHRGRKLQS